MSPTLGTLVQNLKRGTQGRVVQVKPFICVEYFHGSIRSSVFGAPAHFWATHTIKTGKNFAQALLKVAG